MIFTEQMTLGNANEALHVQLKKSTKRRTWSLQVKPGGEIIFAIPHTMAPAKIAALLASHEPWIRKKVSRQKSRTSMRLVHPWHDGEEIYFQGQHLRLALQRGHYPSVTVDEQEIVIRASDHQPHKIKNIFEDWVALETENHARKILPKWSARFGLREIPALHFRKLKSSWGQCRSDGKITLHQHLGRLHPEFMEYVLVHELCHIFHMNHGAAFKALLADHIPHWREIKRIHEPTLA